MKGRLPRTLVIALVVGLGIGNLYWAITGWSQTDAEAYWQAALRLRAGDPLYPMVSDVEASDIYRYAPWFAYAAVPFTFLPTQLAGGLWSVVLVAASCLAVLPLVQRRAWLQIAFFWPILIGISAIGNVHPLIIAVLVHGLERRSGPVWVGLMASLKIVPILFALFYLGRGEFRRAGTAVLVGAVLWGHAIAFELDGYVTSSGQAGLLLAAPIVFGAVAALASMISVRLAHRRSPLARLSAATTAVLATPRFFVYDLTYLLAGIPSGSDHPPRSDGERARGGELRNRR